MDEIQGLPNTRDMKSSTLKNQALLGLSLMLLSMTPVFGLSIPSAGTLNITILDENGALVEHAPVYIYGEAKTKFIGGKEIAGNETLNMPAGMYSISCAIMRKTGEYYDRFASPEAHVEVVAGDNSVVTLRLHALDDMSIATSKRDGSILGSDGDQIARNF
jgi:hypothetical protein